MAATIKPVSAHPIVQSLEQAQYPVIFALARSVSRRAATEGVEITTLLETSAEGWGETGLDRLDAVERGDDDTPGPLSVAVAVAPRTEAGPDPDDPDAPAAGDEPADAETATDSWRLVVFGDSDFATNGQLANVGNPTLLANAFNWLLEREKLLGIGPKQPEQVRLTLTPGQLSGITWGSLLGLPGLAVTAGVLVWFRRRR